MIDNCHGVDDDLKDKLWTDILVFIRNFTIYFTSIDDHLVFLFNANIISIT